MTKAEKDIIRAAAKEVLALIAEWNAMDADDREAYGNAHAEEDEVPLDIAVELNGDGEVEEVSVSLSTSTAGAFWTSIDADASEDYAYSVIDGFVQQSFE